MNARVVTGCDPKGQIFSFNGIMGNWVWVLWFLFKKKQKKTNKQRQCLRTSMSFATLFIKVYEALSQKVADRLTGVNQYSQELFTSRTFSKHLVSQLLLFKLQLRKR